MFPRLVGKFLRGRRGQASATATADSTPEICVDSCIFTDEIDSYPYVKFVKGTKALFHGPASNVQLVGDVDVVEDGKKIRFRFAETLAVNIPVLQPIWYVSGICALTLGSDGLITAYREKWDQSVPEVILATKF